MTPATELPPPDSPELYDFLEAVRPKLRRMLLTSRVPAEDTEDLLHDALLALLHRWHEMDTVARREGWLLGTLRHTIFHYWRRRLLERRVQEKLSLELPLIDTAPQQLLDTAHDAAALTSKLSRRDLKVLWLRYGLELKDDEAAETLGCQPGSVRQLSRRALKRVRRQLAVAAK
jgi:RNA polymerase sigma factor (sigma-70 family)